MVRYTNCIIDRTPGKPSSFADSGSVRLDGDVMAWEMSGQEGVFRKKRWNHRVEATARHIIKVEKTMRRVPNDARMTGIRLQFAIRGWERPLVCEGCHPAEEVMDLLEMLAANVPIFEEGNMWQGARGDVRAARASHASADAFTAPAVSVCPTCRAPRPPCSTKCGYCGSYFS